MTHRLRSTDLRSPLTAPSTPRKQQDPARSQVQATLECLGNGLKGGVRIDGSTLPPGSLLHTKQGSETGIHPTALYSLQFSTTVTSKRKPASSKQKVPTFHTVQLLSLHLKQEMFPTQSVGRVPAIPFPMRFLRHLTISHFTCPTWSQSHLPEPWMPCLRCPQRHPGTPKAEQLRGAHARKMGGFLRCQAQDKERQLGRDLVQSLIWDFSPAALVITNKYGSCC